MFDRHDHQAVHLALRAHEARDGLRASAFEGFVLTDAGVAALEGVSRETLLWIGASMILPLVEGSRMVGTIRAPVATAAQEDGTMTVMHISDRETVTIEIREGEAVAAAFGVLQVFAVTAGDWRALTQWGVHPFDHSDPLRPWKRVYH